MSQTHCTKAILATFALLSPLSAQEVARPTQPNVILLLADDLGWQDLKCDDIDAPSPYETPHIDAFAKKREPVLAGVFALAPLAAPLIDYEPFFIRKSSLSRNRVIDAARAGMYTFTMSHKTSRLYL